VLHGLVNNAVIAAGKGGAEFDAVTFETWDRVMRVNVRGTWLVTPACAALLQASGSGRIVNIARDTAIWGCAAPAGLLIVERCGAGDDPFAGMRARPARHRLYEEGRAVTGAQTPDDIAATILVLLTPGAIALTGRTQPVNAGFVFS